MATAPSDRASVCASFDIGIRNFALCIVGVTAGGQIEVAHWEVIDIVSEAGRPCKTIDEQVRALVEALTRRSDLWDSLPADGTVAVEQQPNNARYGAMSMNVLQHVVGAFFAMRLPEARVANLHASKKFSPAVRQLAGAEDDASQGRREFWYWCASDAVHAAFTRRLDECALISGYDAACGGASERGVTGRLTFRRPRKSLARAEQAVGLRAPDGGLSDSPLAEPPAPLANKRRRYKIHKSQSVAYTDTILAAHPSLHAWGEFFASHAKRDDLADAFLQGLSQLPISPTAPSTSSAQV